MNNYIRFYTGQWPVWLVIAVISFSISSLSTTLKIEYLIAAGFVSVLSYCPLLYVAEPYSLRSYFGAFFTKRLIYQFAIVVSAVTLLFGGLMMLMQIEEVVSTLRDSPEMFIVSLVLVPYLLLFFVVYDSKLQRRKGRFREALWPFIMMLVTAAVLLALAEGQDDSNLFLRLIKEVCSVLLVGSLICGLNSLHLFKPEPFEPETGDV
ncbi:hypothetical protein [Maridesulfovibrio sp. FT414]|uniref:hypothetical protein n=1 Tax=Maridesulfovibrio sp. FT414 TaxID=2979469 RepID=UPI003D808A72